MMGMKVGPQEFEPLSDSLLIKQGCTTHERGKTCLKATSCILTCSARGWNCQHQYSLPIRAMCALLFCLWDELLLLPPVCLSCCYVCLPLASLSTHSPPLVGLPLNLKARGSVRQTARLREVISSSKQMAALYTVFSVRINGDASTSGCLAKTSGRGGLKEKKKREKNKMMSLWKTQQRWNRM